jgi:phosphoglycerol transferase MdoB-like AlkP superfamily enzyme
LAYILIANVPFWLANRILVAQQRPIFNLDYCAIAIASVYIPLWASIAIFTIAYAIDVSAETTHLYYFSQRDFAASIRYVEQLPHERLVVFTFAILVSGIALGWGLYVVANLSKTGEQRDRALHATFVFLVLVAATALTSGTRLLNRDLYLVDRLANSVSMDLLRATVMKQSPGDGGYSGAKIESASERLLNGHLGNSISNRHTNIVLVLVESYGFLNDTESRNQLMGPFLNSSLDQRYELRLGTVRFKGATVSGELRELCGLELGISSISQVSTFADGCLPQIAKKTGYRTLALHGFSGQMFDRETWWRQIGFDSTEYLEDLSRDPTMRRCDGPFSGICDTDIASIIGKDLLTQTEEPWFIYWVTLNSHLPIKKRRINSPFHCGQEDSVFKDEGSCLWASLVWRANQSIADVAKLPNLPPTEFIVVGDHAPPFLSPWRREQFSQTVVPYIDLVPKYN